MKILRVCYVNVTAILLICHSRSPFKELLHRKSLNVLGINNANEDAMSWLFEDFNPRFLLFPYHILRREYSSETMPPRRNA